MASIALAIVLWIALANASPRVLPSALLRSLRLWCLGSFGADLTSGFAHWLCDTFFAETTPIIGQRLVAPFREHHRDPLALTQHGFIELNGDSCTTLLGLMTPLWWLGPVSPRSAFAVFGYLAFLAYCVALSVTNLLHCRARWAISLRRGRCARRGVQADQGVGDMMTAPPFAATLFMFGSLVAARLTQRRFRHPPRLRLELKSGLRTFPSPIA